MDPASVLTLTAGVAASTASAAPAQHAARTAHADSNPNAVTQSSDTSILGTYHWNGNGYTGSLRIYNQASGAIQAELSDNGVNEFISGTWIQSNNELTLTRPLPDGSSVQTYVYFLGGSPISQHPTMFGGYFTSTTTESLVFGSYLDSAI